jgi:hypothetical protein
MSIRHLSCLVALCCGCQKKYQGLENLLKNQEIIGMNKDLFESKWKQIRSQTSIWWNLMSPDDLNKVDKAKVKLDKYATLLRVKYGYTLEETKKEIDKRVSAYEIGQNSKVKSS